MKPIRVAIIGCGYWGPNLVRNFSAIEEFEVAGVADLDPQRLDYISKHYQVPVLTSNVDDLLGDPTVEAVAIATPISTHAPLAEAALDAGKHVLIEKPMAHSVAACDMLIEKAAARGLTLMVDHTFLYTGAVRKIRQLIDDGKIGDIYYFDSVRVNLGLFQHDYNVVWDLAPHDLSIMQYLIDARPVQVSAVGASPIALDEKRLESMAYITVRFDSGILGHIHVNWLAPVKVRMTLLGGSKTMVVYDDTEPDTKIKLYDKGVDVPAHDARREDIYKTLVQYRTGDMLAPNLDGPEALRVECVHFADCIRAGTHPITSGEAGREVVRLIAAADESMRAGGRPVDLV